jgi:predicted Zn-dependent protease
VPVYLSTTLTERAERQSATSLPHALDTINLAARTNPWAVQPLIAKAAILIEAGRVGAAAAAAKEATRRDPNAWTTWQTLADAERVAGKRAAAVAAQQRVYELNPRRRPPK